MTPRWVVYDEPAGGGGGPWDPSQLSDLVIWLDATDLSLANDDPVATWINKGSAADAVQPSTSQQPIFKTPLLNGYPGIRFDGASSAMSVANTSLNTFTSTFAVTKSTLQKPFFLEHGPNANNSPGFQIYGTSNTSYLINRGGLKNGSSAASGWLGTTPAVVSAISYLITSPGVGSSIWRNGSLMQMQTSSGSAVLAASTVTAPFNLMHRGNAYFADGDLHEVVVYDVTLAIADRQRVEGYLAHKWGLAGNLPVSHPYKNAAP